MITSFMVDAIFPHSFARTRIVIRRSLYHKMIPSRKTYIIFLFPSFVVMRIYGR